MKNLILLLLLCCSFMSCVTHRYYNPDGSYTEETRINWNSLFAASDFVANVVSLPRNCSYYQSHGGYNVYRSPHVGGWNYYRIPIVPSSYRYSGLTGNYHLYQNSQGEYLRYANRFGYRR